MSPLEEGGNGRVDSSDDFFLLVGQGAPTGTNVRGRPLSGATGTEPKDRKEVREGTGVVGGSRVQ